MAWHLLEKIIEHSTSHSTLLGKWWIAFVFVFRIIVVASIGDSVYHDEQEKFVCNAKQPGCRQVCYNDFAPISHIRFWAFQIIITGTPPLIFIIMAMHLLVKIPPKDGDGKSSRDVGTQTSPYGMLSIEMRDEKTFSSRSSNFSKYKIDYEENFPLLSQPQENGKISRQKKLNRANSKILKTYVICVIFRTVFEIACLVGQFLLYGWKVPSKFHCSIEPCILTVECYVSRPMEKTIFLFFMFGVGILCTLINLLELGYLLSRRIKRELKMRRKTLSSKSMILGTCSLSDVPKIHNRHHGNPYKFGKTKNRTSSPAPPGYYIPDVRPPSEKYRSPANGFPPIRLRAASFTTSESDVTSDEASTEGPLFELMEENARTHL